MGRGEKKRRATKARSFIVFPVFFFFLRYRPCALRNISLKDESRLKTERSGEKDDERCAERETERGSNAATEWTKREKRREEVLITEIVIETDASASHLFPY